MQEEQIMLPKKVTVRDPNGDHYVIEGLLGKGKSGAVYLVRSRRFKQTLYALKEIINPNKQERERFTFEGKILKQLDHRVLPRVYRVFENAKLKRVYMLMDYIEGRNLEDLRKEEPEQCFSLPLVLALMAPIVDALMYLHTQNPPIIHRDIKPANIIVPVGADEAMLVDFGSAKEYVPNGTATVIAHRSPGFAAPEQYGSGTSPRTDIYGLGATVYLLLTGTMPPDAPTRVARSGNGGSDLLKLANVLKPTVPKVVAEALQRAMSLRVGDRFETVEEFWEMLHAEVMQVEAQIPRVTSVDPPQPLPQQGIRDSTAVVSQEESFARHSTKQLVLLLIFLAVLVAIVLGTSYYFQSWGLAVLLLLGIVILLLALLPLLR